MMKTIKKHINNIGNNSEEITMKILIINCTSERSRYAYYSKGGEGAIFETVNSLRHHFPQSSITTLIQYQEKWSDELNLKVVRQKSVHSLRPYTLIDMLRSSSDLLCAVLWSVINKRLHVDCKPLINTSKLLHYQDADIIIHLGGDLYSDRFGLITIIEHSKEILMGTLLGKPVVMYAESLGPFNNKLSSWLARLTLNRVSLITLRSDISKENILRINVNKPPMYVTADPAFLLSPESPEKVKAILCKIGYDGVRPLIGLTISEDILLISKTENFVSKLVKLSYSICQYTLPERVLSFMLNSKIGRKYRENTINSIVKIASPIVDSLTGQFKARVLLIPHATSSVFDIDEINQRIFQLTKNKSQVKIIKYDYSAKEIKGLIGHCDLFIGSKMHACIAAWSQCVPTIPIASSHKYYGLARSLGQEMYVCKNTAPAEIIDKICKALARRQKIRKELQCKVIILKELAEFNAELVQKYILIQNKESIADG